MTDVLLATEIWLREHGLPSFTRRRVAPSSRRTGAVLALFAGVELAVLVPSRHWPWWWNLLVVAVVPALATLSVARAFDATTRRSATAPGRLLGAACFVTLPTIATAIFASPVAAAVAAAVNVAVLVALAVDHRFGVVAVTRWCIVHGIGQVKAAVGRLSRSVPLLAVVVVSLFYTAEVWQAAAGLSIANLVAVVALFAAAGVLFAVSQIRYGLRGHTVAGAVVDLPADSPARALTPCTTAPKLSRIEQGNVAVLLVVSQLCVVVATAVAFATLIVLLGAVAIPLDVLASWTGEEPARIISVGLGVELHLTIELLSLGAIMAGIAGLVFAVSLAGDEDFQDLSRHQLADELAIALAVRARYLNELSDRDQSPTVPVRDT